MGSCQLPITYGSNAGEFYGLSDNGISYAILSQNRGYDWVMLDNLKTSAGGNVPTPEPATMLLMGTGLAGLIGAKRRKKA